MNWNVYVQFASPANCNVGSLAKVVVDVYVVSAVLYRSTGSRSHLAAVVEYRYGRRVSISQPAAPSTIPAGRAVDTNGTVPPSAATKVRWSVMVPPPPP